MKKRMIFPQNDEEANDSVFHWKQKYNEAVDKWICLDSLLTKVIRESDEKDRQIAFLKDAHDAKCGIAPIDQRDAYRYRFLRDRAWPFEFKGHSAEDADAAIDVAIDSARGEV